MKNFFSKFLSLCHHPAPSNLKAEEEYHLKMEAAYLQAMYGKNSMNLQAQFIKIGDRVINPAHISQAELKGHAQMEGEAFFDGVELTFTNGLSEHFVGEDADVLRAFLTGNKTYDLNQIYANQTTAKPSCN